ncbi:hypothetical protein GA0070610_5067 [Micromonospora echinofusca]|uniref:Excreted virulence factor EspC, type VII ESX diderm n=1 Tax=Micromonospora echinofusca TaxID=47858 RepID=A0A1C5GI07_MICEH|nr:hypothetical protein [Micromonospora echinofusca]SCG18716.1 hypothetical protein GA0070610_5067 [Micromonospora echinofusca]
MANTVDVGAIRDASKKLAAEDGPKAFLRNAKEKLDEVKLSSLSMTILGIGAVGRHNAVIDEHVDNLSKGVEHLQKAADNLQQTASNWEKSDQPWVVK